jgi:DNA-binding IclR family transcriptional regulator
MAHERLIIARMLVEIAQSYRTITDLDFRGLLVGAAVGMGHLEGRPLNASKIAHVLQLPRTTVLRKLGELIERGAVRKCGAAYCLNEAAVNSNSAHVPRVIRVVRKASTALLDELSTRA